MSIFTWHKAIVEKIVDETADTKRFFLKVLGEKHFAFKAGQFITLKLPIDSPHQLRSYSIASKPDDSNVIELCIVRKEDGLGTAYLFDELQINGEVDFRGPAGVFTLPKEVDSDLVFICTGTGVAPFRSMILEYFDQKIVQNKIHLIFGTRFQTDILYESELKSLAEKSETFNYQVALSREKKPNYHHGYVHDLYLPIAKNADEKVRYYICGWKEMIDQAVENLTALGIEKRRIIVELYD